MIQYVTNDWRERYEAFISGHPKGHFVKSLKWAEFKKPWKTETFLSLNENGEIRGSMLLFLSRVPHTKFTHMYCPRGPVVDDGDTDTLKELCDEAKRLAKDCLLYTSRCV